MCIGMEYIQLNDMSLALDALHAALDLCSEDALLNNEIGIVYYNMGRYVRCGSVWPETDFRAHHKIRDRCRLFREGHQDCELVQIVKGRIG